MYIEIKIALNFFLSYLYDKLPRRRVNLFGEELEKYIGQKLTLANWPVTIQSNSSHTSTPPPPTTSLNESHAITLNKQELYVDPFVISAATESALDLKEIVAQMPDYLKLFIEPGLVAYLLEPPTPESTIASQLPDLKILYKLPQIDLSTLTYISGNFKESSIYQNSVTHIAEDSASTSGDLTATNSILNENLLQLLSAAATAANVTTTSSSPNSSGVSAAPLQYFMQKLSLNEEQTSQVLSNLGQLSKQQQQPPKVASLGLGFPSAQFKPTLSPTDPIIQADYGSFNNRNAISPTGGTELWSSSSSCSSSSSSTGGSSSCLSMQQPSAPSSLPTSSSSPSSKSVISNLDTTSPSLLLAAVDGNVKKPPTSMSSQPANIPVMKPPSSLFTTAEFAQTKFGSTKSKNSYYAPGNKPGKSSSSSTAPQQPHNPNHSQSSPIAPQPLLSPQNSHSFHNPYHHAHHQQQKMNPEFSAYIKQKAAVQQLLKSSSVHPILGSPTSTLPTNQQSHLNGMMKPPPQLSSHLSTDAYLDLNLITNHLNSTNLIYDMDNSNSNTSSSCSSSSTGSLTSPQHTQQQNHQAQQHQLNLLLMNLLKANSSGFDYLNSSPLFAATSSSAANFNDHHTNFDSIVNSTIKEMIDGDLDEFDETTTEDAKPITNSEFDENNNNNNNLATNLIDDE